MKKVLILGSTGSIGTNTLNVIREFRDKFKVVGVSSNSNISLLEKQIKEFNPEFAIVRNPEQAAKLREKLTGVDCEVLEDGSGLISAAKNIDYDIMVSSLMGFAGLAPTIEGIKRSKRIALANKETLVVAGELITKLAKEYHSEILPVDSEHSAIFQILVGEKPSEIRKLIITASGGPFREKSAEELKTVTIEQALNHPNWDMGKKITIDSATMMNKGLEVIEAHWLFDLPNDKIDVVVHPQSIIHSMVEFVDGSIKAQLSTPDMKLPIQYALTYPERLTSSFVETNFPEIHKLSFYKPDFHKFTCLKLAFEVLEAGGSAPCILNAANEVAVDKFLNGELEFLDIPKIISLALEGIEKIDFPDIETIFDCDSKTRKFVANLFN